MAVAEFRDCCSWTIDLGDGGLKLYHATTEKKAKKYREIGKIIAPVRGFDTMTGAMAWAMKVGRRVIYEITVDECKTYKLPDHHNQFGTAFWCEVDCYEMKCIVSPKKG